MAVKHNFHGHKLNSLHTCIVFAKRFIHFFPWQWDLLEMNFIHHNSEAKKLNYFTSSDPHHDMLGGGCQVRVVIENMMGRMENLRTLISGFLGLVILVRWALVTMFLS